MFWGFINLLFRQWTGGKNEIKAVICNSTTLLPTIESFLWKATILATTKQRKPESNNSTLSTFPVLPWKMYFCMQNFSGSSLKWHKCTFFTFLWECTHVQLSPSVTSVLHRVMIFTFQQTKWQNIYYSNIILDSVIS